jgi:hypothetical protein
VAMTIGIRAGFLGRRAAGVRCHLSYFLILD